MTLASLGGQMGYTPAYLSTLFAQKMGISFSHYLQNLRIAQACQLLASSEDSIEEIALRCGYSDLKFFRALFRSRLRMTPSEFRGKSRR